MLAAGFFEGFVEFTQKFALMFAQLDRGLHRNVTVQIARVAGTHTLDTFATQAELFAGLRALRDVNGGFAGQRRNLNFTTQRSGNDADRHRAVDVIPIALENIVLFEADFDLQVTRRAAIGAWLAVTGAANAHATVNAGRNFDFECFLFLDLALPVA